MRRQIYRLHLFDESIDFKALLLYTNFERRIKMATNKINNDQQENAGILKEIMDLIAQLNTRNLTYLLYFARGLRQNQIVK